MVDSWHCIFFNANKGGNVLSNQVIIYRLAGVNFLLLVNMKYGLTLY